MSIVQNRLMTKNLSIQSEPSCGAWRITGSAALLVEDIPPEAPVRQWILSFLYALRFLFATRTASTAIQIQRGPAPLFFGWLKVDSDPRNQSSRFDKRRSRAERRPQDDGPEGARQSGRVIPLSPPITGRQLRRGSYVYCIRRRPLNVISEGCR